MISPVPFSAVEQARERLNGRLRRSHLVPSPSLSELARGEVYLKLEHQQITGSFKLRGATNAVLALSQEERDRGIVGVSTGNHGRGLAYAAREAGAQCIVCMSELVPKNKVDGIKAQGADVRIVGRSQDDAQLEADRLIAEQGMTQLSPFDHPDVIAGQGTLGLEILEQLPETETLLVPLSGGGLISGVALAAKSANPAIRIVGISMDRGPAMVLSQKAGKPIHVAEEPTLADSLGGGIGLENRYTFPMVRDLVDEMLLVDEVKIAEAIRHAYWQERQIIEGSGSVGIAALLDGYVPDCGPTVVVVSGGNIDLDLHHRIISGENVEVGD